MARLLFIFSLCFITSFILKAQELNVGQTLAYINKQLNEKNNKFSEIKIKTFVQEITVSNVDRVFMRDYSYDVKIEHGSLSVTRTFSKMHTTNHYNSSTGFLDQEKFIPIIEEWSVPIKDIDIDNHEMFEYYCNVRKPASFLIWVKNKNVDFVTKLSREFDYTGSELHKKTEKLDYCSIEFSNDNLICEKIRNAFTHLIELASKDSNYNTIDIVTEKDPFANSIRKDTISSNSISTTNTNSIPMTKVGGVYEVPVIINGVLKLNFIFDAGASDVSISPDVALTLIRTGTVTDKDFLGTETYKFADGSTAKSKVFLIKEIQLGNKKVNNVRATISKSINAPLLLGQSVLNKFGKVTIDYNKGVIIFQD